MARSTLFDVDTEARRKLIHHEEDGQQYFEMRQDVSGIIEAAKIVADQPPGKDFRHVAFVPDSELNRAFVEGWFHDRAAWKKWLNDPANREYRTWKGRI